MNALSECVRLLDGDHRNMRRSLEQVLQKVAKPCIAVANADKITSTSLLEMLGLLAFLVGPEYISPIERTQGILPSEFQECLAKRCPVIC